MTTPGDSPAMVADLLRALTRKRGEPAAPVETLDLDAIRSRIGGPLPPKSEERAGNARADGRQGQRERSWRRTAGLPR